MTTHQPAIHAAGREQFHAFTSDVWRAFRHVRDRDLVLNTRDEKIAYLLSEAAARDLVTHMLYAFDAGDARLTASLFTPDATIDGQSEVLAHIEKRMASCTFSRSRVTNTIVRVSPGGEEIWLTLYLHQAHVSPSGEVDSRYSRCLGRLEKSSDGWRIADWFAAVDLIQRYGTEDEMAVTGPQAHDRLEPDRASRAFTTHNSPPSDGGRATWDELREDVWEAHHWFADQQTHAPSDDDEQLQRLVDELQIRELLANYAYAHDSRDLAWTGSVFTDNAILINDLLRFDGNAQVIEAFRGFNRRMTISFHRFANPQIKFVPGRPEAWFIAYYHVPTIGPEERCQYSFGRYFSRLTKRTGRWQVEDWRIANDPTILPMQLSAEVAS